MANQPANNFSKFPKPVIGMMGAPGSGKSLVASQFQSLGAQIIDADQLAREAFEQPAVIDQLRSWWGNDIFDQNNKIDRLAIAKHVFGNKSALDKLENLVHPVVGQLRTSQRSQAFNNPNVKFIVEDCPLLLEVNLDSECDKLVFVDAPFPIRLQRVQANRGWDEAELRKREKNQASLDTKRQRADYVISNDATEAHCLDQVRNIASLIFS